MANRFLSNIRINDAYTFPASDGSNGQVIITDGSGNLAFADPSTSSSASVIYRDNFTGDGSTVAFTLQNSLSDEDQTFIYIDGVYQEKDNYSLSDKTITFTTAPESGHSVEVISISGINVGPTTIYQDNFTGDGLTTEFNMAQSVDNEVKTMIYFNGVYQFKGTYTVNGSLITFDTAPANGVAIEVISIASAAAGEEAYSQELLFYGKASEAISKGDAVMFAGSQGDHFLFAKATQAAIEANHEYLIGLATQDLATNEYGYVTEFGSIVAIDTDAYEQGDILWFDAGGTTAGALTTTEPAAPLAKIQVAAVIRKHQNEGVLFVRPTWFHALNELHDVNITSIADKDILAWNNTQGYWENTKTLDSLTANTLSATTLTGTLSTAAQTNITSVGTLSSLDVNGTASATTLTDGLITISSAQINRTDGAVEMQWNGADSVRMFGNTVNPITFYTNGSASFTNGTVTATAITDTYITMSLAQINRTSGFVELQYPGNGGVQIFGSTSYPVSFLSGTGRVGIGTNSPNHKLTIDEATGSSYVLSARNTNDNLQIKIGTTVSGYANIQCSTVSANAAYNMSLQADGGNLGIGTLTPASKFTVQAGSGSISGTGISYINNIDDAFALVINNNGNSSQNDRGVFDARVGGSSVFRVNNSGNVGIGTTTPSQKLTVNGNIVALDANASSPSYSYFGLFTENGSLPGYPSNSFATLKTDDTDMYFSANGAYTAFCGWDSSNGWGYFGVKNSASSRNTVIRGGNGDSEFTGEVKRVGIGTNGSYYIALSGNLSGYTANAFNAIKTNQSDMHFDVGGVYTGYINANGGFTDVSDASLKTNIEYITNALTIVSNLKGRKYNWIDQNRGTGKQIGFIAQEVEEFVPEVVTEGAEGTKGVAYGKLTAVLVEAIKEQQAIIEDLKARIETLENN